MVERAWLSTEEGSLGRRQHKQVHRGKKGWSWEEPSTQVGGAWSERVWKVQLGCTVEDKHCRLRACSPRSH